MKIFHIATAADWAEARKTGSYTTSTIGRTLAEEGFIHASRRDQVAPTFARYYRGVRGPLVLLTIDTDRLDSLGIEWREDPVDQETFPHIYGALPPRAVVDVQPLDRKGATLPFTVVLFKDIALRMFLALAVMGITAGLVVLGRNQWGDPGSVLGAVVGLAAGTALAFVTYRRVSSP